jgi:hypothetical protein
MMYPDDLRAALAFLDWLNDNHSHNTTAASEKLKSDDTLWTYAGRIQIVNPEHGNAVGWAVWHGDGFWWFEPPREK